MSRLTINAKLALPGLCLLTRDLFFGNMINEELLFKLLPDSIKAFNRFSVSTTSLRSAAEAVFTDVDFDTEPLRKDITAFVKLLKNDPATHSSIIDLFSYISKTLAGNNSGYIQLRNSISILQNAELILCFPIEVDTSSQRSYIDYVSSFDSEELKLLKESKDPKYKQVLSAKRASRSVVQDFVRDYCRARKGLADYESLIQELSARNLEHTYPVGFIGLIDEHSRLVTIGGRVLSSTPYGCSIVMNPKYDPKTDDTYVCSARSPSAKSSTYIYTAEYKKTSKEQKFAVVKQLSTSIDKLRASWLKLLVPNTTAFEPAMILELIYQTQARIGDDRNATLDKRTGKYKRTYGMSTLLGTHVSVEGDTAYFNYPGKAAFKGDHIHLQKHTFIPDAQNQVIIRWLAARQGLEQKLFTCSAQAVRNLLTDLGAPEGTTVHKLRTLRGTLMMQERIKNHPFKSGGKITAVNKWLKEQALDVGIQLGHMSGEKYTASTAIAHYIDPITMMKLYKEAKLSPPRTMLKLVGVDINSMDSIE